MGCISAPHLQLFMDPKRGLNLKSPLKAMIIRRRIRTLNEEVNDELDQGKTICIHLFSHLIMMDLASSNKVLCMNTLNERLSFSTAPRTRSCQSPSPIKQFIPVPSNVISNSGASLDLKQGFRAREPRMWSCRSPPQSRQISHRKP